MGDHSEESEQDGRVDAAGGGTSDLGDDDSDSPRERSTEREADDSIFGASYGMRWYSERNPEAAVQRPVSTATRFENISRADLREHYGVLRTLFKRRGDSYQSFQHQLIQAWIPETYDRYLAATVKRMGQIFVVVTLLTVCLAATLVGGARAGYLPALSLTNGTSIGTIAAATVGTGATLGVGIAGLYWAWHRVYRVRSRISRRRREITYNLPFAVTFMYALARAGVSYDRILIQLADARSTYGAVAEEYERVVRDMEMFGNNLYTGLDNLRAVTPSNDLKRLTDDLMTVLESGGDMSAFLRDEVDMQLESAIEEQETFIERLEVVSEVFVVGIVATPLFVLVVLIVISFLGGNTVPVISVLTYVAIPLALAGFVIFIDVLSQPFRATAVDFSEPGRQTDAATAQNTPQWGVQYERNKRVSGIRNRVWGQIARVRENPGSAFLFSVPIALTVPVAGLWTEQLPRTLSGLLATPVNGTVGLAVAPLVIATTPVVLLYEYRKRQEASFKRRFPVLLELLAASNRRGLSLVRGLDILTASADGRMKTELQQLRNDIRWNFDIASAFEAFGNRIDTPEIARTVKLIAEGSRATSDLHPVLDVAATDTTERIRLQQKRQQTLQTYIVIVIIGFLVYLLVVLMLASNFLDPIEALSTADTATTGGPVSINAIPVSQLRLLLFHSALIQGFGSGVLAGKLADDSMYSGLKYGLALVLVATAAFTVI